MRWAADAGAARPPTAWGGGGFSISAEEARRLTGSLSSQTTQKGRQSFAYLFTVALLCLYSAPVVLALQLGLDPDAAFFVGRYGQGAYAIPFWLLAMHVVILTRFADDRKCGQRTFVCAAVVPAILLASTGGLYMSSGHYWDAQIMSEDCSSFGSPLKPRLEAAYQEALAMFSECEQRMVAGNGGRMPMWRPTLQGCQEWSRIAPESAGSPWRPYAAKAAEANHQWEREFQYLASVEANHICGGFCTAGPMLWSDYDRVGRQGGKCAPMVGLKMRRVSHQGLMLLVVSLVGISSFFFLYALMADRLKPFLDDR
mmetsp:Transcript_100893/g.260773  ORF Transcript_100893/g.260773 Transcript_100893/m.260773 type:complete len:313 (+) Transcript_100893:75-1013(+)